MKIYRNHYCTRTHRTHRTMAGCLWKRAAWITGNGPYAVLAHCRVLTVTLHSTLEAAQKSKALIDSDACGGLCHNHHEIIQLRLEAS